ncbi:sensor histidine kinase [Chitinophaga nivalis]|uniref:Histidine kinase n=1 Tax=Chitinophaga nivalis TaxID=2991709 RepID=A0ABT3IS58_9BACT|nr:sensor histidine kinase [Chitinophaga nivalis]MCW3463497.1 histidine kinase [Chitinophaga nivalis]MCW3486813.1 histidine kinase [Chitinophaga nivalis]
MKIVAFIKQFKFYLWVGLAYLFLMMLGMLSEGTDNFAVRLVNQSWQAIYIVGINYLFFEHILPQLSRKRLGRSFLLLAGQIFLSSFGLYMWRQVGIQLHVHTPLPNPPDVGDHFGSALGSFFFFGIIRNFYNYTILRQTAQQLRIEKQAAELNYLKSQTNPHFLFNTLNNIYSLARDKSDLAPESILRLSKILRFMLYETSGRYIAIEEELKIIDDYIALEKLRYDDSLRVSFHHNIEDRKQALPPLLLMPLVENAFKHGVSETRNQPFVDIHLSVNQRQLTFYVKNSTESFPGEKAVRENIGLSNLRRQLELLYTDFSLTVQPDTGVFTVTLNINLASHV